jgi:uncharacterized protein YndB with AHSA1/START domain
MAEKYTPGPAYAQVEKTPGDSWRLILVRHLKHAPDKVWRALTQPEQLSQWAPFDASTNLGTVGANVKLTWVGSPGPHVTETQVSRAEFAKELEYMVDGNPMRWQLEATDSGTKLTLWASIDRRYVAMGAAGWQICLDVLDHALAGTPISRKAGPETMKFEGWQRLNAEYTKLFS